MRALVADKDVIHLGSLVVLAIVVDSLVLTDLQSLVNVDFLATALPYGALNPVTDWHRSDQFDECQVVLKFLLNRTK